MAVLLVILAVHARPASGAAYLGFVAGITCRSQFRLLRGTLLLGDLGHISIETNDKERAICERYRLAHEKLMFLSTRKCLKQSASWQGLIKRSVGFQAGHPFVFTNGLRLFLQPWMQVQGLLVTRTT